MAHKSIKVYTSVPYQATSNLLRHQHRIEVLWCKYLLQPLRCRVAVVKGFLNLRRRDNVELWSFKPCITAHVAYMVPTVPGAKVIRKSGVIVNVHARIPLINGMSVGVARSPVGRSLRRGTPTSAVNIPLLCDRAWRSYDTGPSHGAERSVLIKRRNVNTGHSWLSSGMRLISSSSRLPTSGSVKDACWSRSLLFAALAAFIGDGSKVTVSPVSSVAVSSEVPRTIK